MQYADTQDSICKLLLSFLWLCFNKYITHTHSLPLLSVAYHLIKLNLLVSSLSNSPKMTTKLSQTERLLAVFILVFCLRESIQVKNNPNLQKMLEEDRYECHTSVSDSWAIVIKTKWERILTKISSQCYFMYFKRCSNIHRQ